VETKVRVVACAGIVASARIAIARYFFIDGSP